MYTSGDLKRGLIIEVEGAPCVVESVSISTPTARGGNTITRVRMRDLRSQQKLDKSFRGNETFPVPDVEKKPVQLLYADAQAYHFMEQESFEQFGLDAGDLEWERNFLVDGIEGVRALFWNGSPIALELPNSVNLAIAETSPGVKGNSATGRTKPATLETGFTLQVPEHIDQGVKITVDTRTGDFQGRAKD